MKKFYLIGFAFLLLFDTAGQSFFKLTADNAFPPELNFEWLWRVFSHPYVYVAIAGYIGAFFSWMTLLKKAPVGPAFAASHLEVVTTMIVSIWLFNEEINLTRFLGALFIVIGIIFLALAEKQVEALEKKKEKEKKAAESDSA